MARLEILTYPDPFLRKKAAEVTKFNGRLDALIEDMIQTMYDAPGTGLAATQVGKNLRIIVYDLPEENRAKDPRVLVNPEIIESDGEILSENEGCLSVPDFRADVKRYAKIRVKAQNQDGKPVLIDGEGFHAIVLQHEIDHLNGILFIDRISALKRGLYKRRLKKKMKELR